MGALGVLVGELIYPPSHRHVKLNFILNGLETAKSDDPAPWVHVKALGLLAEYIDLADNVRCPLAISRHFDSYKSPTNVRIIDPVDLHSTSSLLQRLSDVGITRINLNSVVLLTNAWSYSPKTPSTHSPTSSPPSDPHR